MSAAPDGGRPGVPLTPALERDIESRLARLRAPLGERALSDCSFTNLYLFRSVHSYRFLKGEYPVVCGSTYDGTDIRVPLFDLTATPLEALRTLQGEGAWFYPVAEPVAELLDAHSFVIEGNRNDSDYLYSASTFENFDGPGLGPKRHASERVRTQGRIGVHPIDASNRAQALAVLEGWCADKGKGMGEADIPACAEALASVGTGSALTGFLHDVDGVPAGFLLVESLNPGVLVVRFAKGRAAYDGIFSQMFQDLARRMAPAVRWLNFEQDLGNANFRRTKLSFRPAALLTKYRVRVRS